MSYSLLRRLSLGSFFSLVSAFMLLWLLIHISVQYLIYDYIYNRLTHDSETLLAASIKNPQHIENNFTNIANVYQQPFSGHYYEINIFKKNKSKSKSKSKSTKIKNKVTQKQPQSSIVEIPQKFRSRSLWDQNLVYKKQQKKQQNNQQIRLKTIGPMQQPLLLLVSHYYDNGYEITIAVAEDVTAINEAITQFKIKFSVAVIFILIILLSMQMWGLKKGLTPLRQLQQDLKNLEKGKISHLDTYVPIELNSLVKEINQLHSALDVKLSRHRNALADLAHALKKPLTVLQLLSKDEQLIHLPNIKATLTKQTEITNQLIHRILNKARLAGKVKASSVFDFKTDLTELIDTLNMMYQQRNITIMVNCADNLSTTFDREDLLELLGNLLDNAFKWAKSTVIVTINQQQDFSINVEDDGNGIPIDKLPYIPQRGLRLDETVAGHGLGLGIVDDIIEHYEGSINYQTSPQLGGLRVSISLPLK